MFGNVKYEAGLLFNKGNFKLVKKVLKRDEKLLNIIMKMKKLFLQF